MPVHSWLAWKLTGRLCTVCGRKGPQEAGVWLKRMQFEQRGSLGLRPEQRI